MNRAARSLLLGLACLLLMLVAAPLAAAAEDADAIDKTASSAYEEGKYAFCTNPDKPLMGRQQALCSLSSEIKGCDGFRAACDGIAKPPKDESGWLKALADLLGPIAKILIYLLVIGIVVVVAIPVINALRRFQRNRKLAEQEAPSPNRAALIDNKPIRPDEVTDAEAALRRAEEHRLRGELDRALGLYLAASLAALDRRGAIRIARHRTNGEYVRACEEEASRPSLREIVREVDQVEFGGKAPTDDGVVRVASRATAIVRRVASAATSTLLVVVLIGVFALGCTPARQGADPAGDGLPIEVLRRNGFKVGALSSSLATIPIPTDDKSGNSSNSKSSSNDSSVMSLIIVDVDKVPLEEEAHAHMMRWVEAGGVLVLFGDVHSWPKSTALAAKYERASTRDLVLRINQRSEQDVLGAALDAALAESGDEEADDRDRGRDRDRNRKPKPTPQPIEIKGARTARASAFTWKDSESLAFLGDRTYAAKKHIGKGMVLGIANSDLFTNVGILPPRNAAALVTLIRAVSQDPMYGRLGDIRVARAEDGIPPPSNPFAALVAAGLGKGTWHALVAALLLFLAYGIRHAQPRAPDRETRRAFAEHIEATGAFYGRTKAHTHALGAYGRFMEMRLREIIPRGADPAAFLAARSGVSAERATELYTRATQAKAGDAPRGDELNVIEELRRMMEKAR